MLAEVYLWGTRIGFVSQESISDIPIFNYDKDFIRSGIEVSPIVMPVNDRIYSFPALSEEAFHKLPGLLSDSLPDKFGTRLVEKYLSEQGRSLNQLTSVERLCFTGSRGMGALEYVPAKGYKDISDTSIDIDALVKLASDILSEREGLSIKADKYAMEKIIKVGSSAGGARAKAIIAWNKSTNDIRSGQVEAGSGYEYYIIKFDGVENNKDKGDKADGEYFTRIEYAYYLMATASGIYMTDCEMLEDSGKYHFMTKRFDRKEETGDKIHMQTLGALAHFDYNEPGAHSYEQVSDIIYRLGMGQEENEQLYKRMVFNVIARNQDDHVKNISFLMDKKGVWKLSPAYDITYAYDESNYWLARHQMSINGKLDNYDLNDLLECGRHMNISLSKIKKIITDVKDSLNNWAIYAEKSKLPEKVMEEIKTNFINI